MSRDVHGMPIADESFPLEPSADELLAWAWMARTRGVRMPVKVAARVLSLGPSVAPSVAASLPRAGHDPRGGPAPGSAPGEGPLWSALATTWLAASAEAAPARPPATAASAGTSHPAPDQPLARRPDGMNDARDRISGDEAASP